MQNSQAVATFRKLTPAMIESQRLAQANDIPQTSKAEVSLALKKAAPALGIDGTTYHILDILVGLTAADDWQRGQRPLVAISNEKLAEYVCRSKRTVIRCIKRLVEAGVLAYRDSPTGRRYIHRSGYHGGKYGEIERGYGLDFSPARQRVQELQQMGADFAARLQRQKDAKRSITRLLRAIADMQFLAQEQGIEFSDLSEQTAQLREAGMSFEDKAEALQVLYDAAVAKLSADQTENTTCAGDINDSPYNHTNPRNLESSNKRSSANAEPISIPKREQAPAERAFENEHSRNFQANPADQSQVDHLEHLSLPLLAQGLEQLQETLGISITSWQALAEQQQQMALLIGLSSGALAQAQNQVGGYLASAILAVTCEKALRDPLAIARPGGYFRACVDRARTGNLALHRTLFGLAAGT
ncbi:plasmid replication protein RepC [Polycladidibacter hongkongensis]|uniref:plasmid replication protein RepC n=1 Tax=Polycladidibacter hongkongensis TaxID=1647556 RepID=UPI000829B591|nr:plasmid replication protein RepC [Pseudovibrio hongkongensis]